MRIVCPHCGGTAFKVLKGETGTVQLECLTCNKILMIDIPSGPPEREEPQ
jgi:uncharacterized Zn finger protein